MTFSAENSLVLVVLLAAAAGLLALAQRIRIPYPILLVLGGLALGFVPGMPRIAIEAVVMAPAGDVRVITTHLEYYSALQRMAQTEALRTVYADGYAHARDGRITMDDGSPFQTFMRPKWTVITGDFNFEPDAPEHSRMLTPFDDGTPALFDAWQVAHPGSPHPSTQCIYQKTDSSDEELHCDFIFLGGGLDKRLKDIVVDQQTQASDHQPVIVTLDV